MGLLDDAASVISGGGKSTHSKRHHSSHSKHGHGHSHSHHSSSSHHRDHHRSRSRSRSPHKHHSSHSGGHGLAAGLGLSGIAASIFGGGHDSDSDSDRKSHHSSSKHHHTKHSNGSRASFFGIGGGNASRSSFFSGFGGGGARSPSYYKRSPRPNFVSRVLRKLKRLLRDLVYYAKRNPMKVFMLVIMPLITGGALTALLARFGLRLPGSVERMMGVATKAATGDSIGLVGEAVRMASGGLGGGGGSSSGGGYNHTHATIERGRNGGMQWERRVVEKDGVFGGGWGDSFKGITKMFS
ncbi:hypothetical protein B0H63DRAFT_18811 [Podospora didyma]|uniref:Uncharacterized protein n=1 Tax=Podospora didyma TaxID=330526 RepID=A0AAE0P569_9PEZI|nr:hypothetical protein B0H63DRAFT_18811 [Podospora didyma]